MWQQKEEALAKASVAEQQQQMSASLTVENATACSCASATVDVTNSGCFSNNKLANNSKLLKKADIITTEEEEAIDSGFISGPQNILSENNLISNDKEENENKKNQGQLTKLQQQLNNKNIKNLKELDKESTILDSGCIEIESEEEEEEEEEDEVEEKIKEKEETNELEEKGEENKNQMRFKHNVDSGITERFCSLSLTGSGGDSINNLNATTPRRHSTAITTNNTTNNNNLQNNHLTQRQTSLPTNNKINNATTTTATSSTTTLTATTRLNDWEDFYQQNSDGDTPLHLACFAGAEDVVTALLRIAVHPCLYNIQNDDAQTPLHMAALSSQPKILRTLLIAGADPTIRDRHGNTALHIAVNSGEVQCVTALITPVNATEIQEAQRIYGSQLNIDKNSRLNLNNVSVPVDLEIRNYNGERCVHLAAQEGNIEILRLLVNAKADINAREGKSGRSPLHIAIENCNENLLNFLLDDCQQQLDLETATYAGLTAYQVASLLEKSQLQNLLEKRGAEILTPPESDYDYDSDVEELEDSKIFGDPSYFISYNGSNAMRVA